MKNMIDDYDVYQAELEVLRSAERFERARADAAEAELRRYQARCQLLESRLDAIRKAAK